MGCGHDESSVVQGNEGTAYCGACEAESKSLESTAPPSPSEGAASIIDRLEDEWASLLLVGEHGGPGGVWFVDLTREDVSSLQGLLDDAACEIERLTTGGREAATSEVQASEPKSAGGDTSTIRAAHARKSGLSYEAVVDLWDGAAFREAKLEAALGAARRDLQEAIEDRDASAAFAEQFGTGAVNKLQAELGAARERISELEAEAGGRRSAVSGESGEGA